MKQIRNAKLYKLAIKGIPFGKRMSAEEAKKIIKSCQHTVLNLGYEKVRRRESA